MAAADPAHLPSSILKGKARQVDLEPVVEEDETTPLLPSEDVQDSDASNSRLHRKLRKGVVFTGLRRASGGGGTLPQYANAPNGEPDPARKRGLRSILNGLLALLLLLLFISIALVLREDEIQRRPHRPPPNPSSSPNLLPTTSGFPFPSPEPSPLPPDTPRNPAYLIHAKHGAVSSESKLCSDIGVDVLKDGGSAIDAAIASALCIGTMNMFSSGIGGGGFLTVRLPPKSKGQSSTAWTVDFRETAPKASNSTMFKDNPSSAMFGGLSVAVPGELKGFWEAHQRWGKLPWKRLFEPNVRLAKGWKASKLLVRRLQPIEPLVLAKPEWWEIFAPNGRLVEEGETVSRLKFARTLEAIAEHGIDDFYKGAIARRLIESIQASGGVLTMDDLADYDVIVQPALTGSYRGRNVYTTHAPTSGAVLLHVLNLLEKFDFLKEGRTALNVHRTIEALKFGFAARTKISDPIVSENTERMTDIPTKKYAETVLSNLTDKTTHTTEWYGPVFDVPEDHGTMHVSVLDKDGMAVGLTSTINIPWGSQIMDTETGIILNDEMDDFATPGRPNFFGLWPSPYNFPAPGKRALSSIAPTVIEHLDGSFYAILGGAGGSRIFPGIIQTLLNLDWGMDVSAAIEFPRVHDQLFPTYVSVESTFPDDLLQGLEMKGHNITVFDINTSAGVVQAVVSRDGKITAASDSRKYGVAAGY